MLSPDVSRRSTFELVEIGEYRDILSNIQFQIDGLKSSSIRLRQYSASRLVGLVCKCSEHVLSELRSKGESKM